MQKSTVRRDRVLIQMRDCARRRASAMPRIVEHQRGNAPFAQGSLCFDPVRDRLVAAMKDQDRCALPATRVGADEKAIEDAGAACYGYPLELDTEVGGRGV